MRAHTLLDEVMPACDVSSRHEIWVAARPGDVYEAARHADLGRPALVRVLMGLRVAPTALAALVRGRGPKAAKVEQPSFGGLAFTTIAEAPGEEFVLGIMGRFWRPAGGIVTASAEQFRRPPPAGLAQAAWNFRVAPAGMGTALSTETRVRCGDPETLRQFTRYWRIIRGGSGLIRGSMLRHIRRTAEGRHAI